MPETNTAPAAADAAQTTAVAGYGAAEIVYLISQGSGALRDRNAAALQVRPEAMTEQIAALGASSLLARGEITADGGTMELRGGARILNQALNAAVRWTEVAMVNGTGVEAALYVQSRDVSVFLQPAALGTWFMVVTDPQAGDARMLKQVMDSNLARHPEAAMYFGSQLAGLPKDHFFVRASGDGLWDVAHVEKPGEQDRTDGVGTQELLARLAGLLALPAEAAQ
ncbi:MULTISPECIES: hypothetical protein [unclassified Arthrobacter]|uniref:hypothetical protein n=1 Tax=unclassified Arthrobacter TaxID=235627 RepID=UPI00159D3BCC|nr:MULTISPECIES: hypothetical protein [unclassified Arthrobacter]MCQ9164785.1 hypothetical protein [Arthrobacter sp. STN4]NVM98767.1 hypothetical protein [Arthrobacter sp. SDTb3-6]